MRQSKGSTILRFWISHRDLEKLNHFQWDRIGPGSAPVLP